MSLILVTGGGGKTGRRVSAQLAESRLEHRVASRSATGPGSVRFDWSLPQTYDAALDGVTAVYLVAPPGVVDPLSTMMPFLQRALEKGVTRFVLLSASSLEENGPMMGAVHGWLRLNAPSWIVLRPTWFMQNFSEQQHLPTILADDTIYSATDDGRVSFIDAEDIAAVAVVALTEPEFANGDLVLTGPDCLSYDDAAFAPALAAMDTAISLGAEDRTTQVVLNITGRPPGSFQEFAARNVPVWNVTA